MKALAKYWKVLLAIVLVAAAAFLYFNKYENERLAYEREVQQLNTMIMTLEANIKENMKYADVQDQLEDAKAEVNASRLKLYKSFPVEMLEEDQIMYVLYLEKLFKEEIFFSFSEPVQLVPLNDGSVLEGLQLAVNYRTTYKGFQEMVNYLATDSRVASVVESTIEYDAQNDVAVGYLSLMLYLLDTDAMEYTAPDVAVPDTGKNNIFK